MTQDKKVGRPRKFEKDEALLAAIDVFWEKGYDGASMKDLTSAMGINSPSLYSVFGDKESLYIQAIQRYMNDDSCPPIDAFQAEDDIEEAVRAFTKASLRNATQQPKGKLGCFISNCVSNDAGSVDGVQQRLKEAIVSSDKKITKRFELKKKKGSLPEDFPSKERARFLFDLRQGQVLRARAGISRKTMEAELDFRVKMVLFW